MTAKTKGQVLVVEDDLPLRRMISIVLRAAGYSIREAVDGQDGLNVVQEEHIDLIMLDLMMPILDGWEFLQRLRGDAATVRIPVLILTASVGAPLVDRAQSMGATRYLVKPLDARTLVEAVNDVLHHPEKRDGSP